MLEDIIHPKRTQKGPWKMFFIGLIYASLSLILVHWFFSQDPDLSKASGMMVVLFLMMFSLPYMYFIIRKEEKEDETVEGFKGVWNAHKDALYALIFSLIFGAGAIFILIWNASVIAAAIGIFTKYSWQEIPLGIGRYMIHGLPEIGAYFVAALAGGIFGVGILRHGIKDERFYKVLQHSIILLFIAIILILIGGIIEVYFTPVLFS